MGRLVNSKQLFQVSKASLPETQENATDRERKCGGNGCHARHGRLLTQEALSHRQGVGKAPLLTRLAGQGQQQSTLQWAGNESQHSHAMHASQKGLGACSETPVCPKNLKKEMERRRKRLSCQEVPASSSQNSLPYRHKIYFSRGKVVRVCACVCACGVVVWTCKAELGEGQAAAQSHKARSGREGEAGKEEVIEVVPRCTNCRKTSVYPPTQTTPTHLPPICLPMGKQGEAGTVFYLVPLLPISCEGSTATPPGEGRNSAYKAGAARAWQHGTPLFRGRGGKRRG